MLCMIIEGKKIMKKTCAILTETGICRKMAHAEILHMLKFGTWQTMDDDDG